MSNFYDDFMADVPRGVSTRFLSEQAVPQERFQKPATVATSAMFDYDPRSGPSATG